jgi:uncharacterized membrane protein YdjX (TVP38/TMEM64 family)
MSDPLRLRNALPLVYAVLILIGFLIGPVVGIVVVIGGAMAMGTLWSALCRRAAQQGGTARDRGARAERRAARRA